MNPILIENFFSTICGCDHWTQRREENHESNIEGRYLERKHEVKKHMQSRSRALEDTHESRMDIIYADRKERNKRCYTLELKILFVLHLLLILKPFMLRNRLKQKKNYGQGRRARMAG